MPLATRARVGRAAAGTLLVLVLVAGLGVGVLSNGDTMSLGVPTVVTLTLVCAALTGWIATGRWTSRSPAVQERILLVLVAVPGTTALWAQVMAEPGAVSAFGFIMVIGVAAGLVLRPQAHAVGTVLVAGVALVDGILDGYGARLGYFTALLLTMAVLAALAARVIGAAVATAEQREHEAEASSRSLRAVVDAARTATTSDATEVLDAVARATANLHSDTAGVYLLHPDGNLRYGATYRIPEHLQDEVFPPTHGLAGQALQADRTVNTNDYSADPRGMGEYKQVGLRAAVATPIRVHDQPVGVLVVGRFEAGGYTATEITALELLADHAGHALALSRAIDEDRQLLHRLQSLRALQEDFVATVSHELRTPLTVIDGLAETLEVRHGALDEQQFTGLLSRLRANTTSLVTIVTSLLDAARLDRGLVEVEQGQVDLWDLVEGSVSRLAPVLTDHEIDLDLDDAVLIGDAALLARVVDNLLTNVERHTPPGTTVRVQGRVVGDECLVVVSDDGPGIDQRDLHRITERFTRGGELHTRQSRGLGLGLALADQVLRLHGTRLLVTSPPGQGAQFQFRLRTVDVPELIP